jgi:hypothetical protein
MSKKMCLADFIAWVKSIDDRSLGYLWVQYCAPDENCARINDTDRSVVIDDEMVRRGLI